MGIKISGSVLVVGDLDGSPKEISETEFGYLDGLTAGTVAASKAVVVDANKDITGFRHLTATGVLNNQGIVTGDDAVLISSAGWLTATGVIKTDDTTEATSTTDGSLQTDGGLSVAKSAVIGDDLDLLSNSAVFKVGSDQPFTLTHSNANNTLMASSGHRLAFGDAGEYLYGDGTDLKIVSSNDIDVTGDVNVTGEGTFTKLCTLASAEGVTTIGSSNAAVFSAAGILNINNTAEATSTTDGSLQTDGGLSVAKSAVIGDDLDLLSDGAIFSVGSTSKFTLTDQNSNNTLMATSGHRLAFGNAGEYIAGDGTDLKVVSSGDVVVTGDLVPSADDSYDLGTTSAAWQDLHLEGDVLMTDSGKVSTAAGNLTLEAAGSDADIVFAGNDGGSSITALTLDMSAAGNATFNGSVTAGSGGSFIIGSADMNEADLEKLDGITNGTAAASKALVLDADLNIGTINQITASYAKIGVLDVNEINSITKTETTLEVVDKLITVASGSSSANSDGAGLKFGGTDVDNVASIKYDHANAALDFNLAGTTEMRLQNGALLPEANNDIDLGSDALEFKDLWLDGVAYIDTLNASALGANLDHANFNSINVDIDSGAIDGTVIGASSVAAGSFAALAAAAGTFSGVLKTDDTTEATSTSDGSLQTDGGLSVAKSAVIGDDLDLLSDSAILTIGSTSKFALTDQAANNCVMASSGHRLAFGNAGEYISGDGTDLKIVSSGDVDITGDTDVVGGLSSTQATVLASAAGTTTIGSTTGAVVTAAGILNVNNQTEATSTSDGSLQTDGGLSVAKSAVVGDDLDLLSDAAIINFGAGKDVNLTHVHDTGLLLNSSRQLQFGDSATHIKQVSDSNLEVEADGSVILDSPVVDFQDDGVILKFGDDSEVTLTHVEDTGLNLVGALSGSSTLRVKGALTQGRGNGKFILDAGGHITSSAEAHFLGGNNEGGFSVVSSNIYANSMAAHFASLNCNDGNITNVGSIALDSISADNGSSFSMGSNWTNASRTVADLGSVTTVDINGGTADNVVIGGATPAAGTFTALVANGNVDLGDATSDTITATGRFDSDLVPSSDSARALGTSALQWSAIHCDAGHIDAMTVSGLSTLQAVSASAGIHVSSAGKVYAIECADGAGDVIAQAFVTHSDRSLKTNIKEASSDICLDKVMKLETVTYEKKATGKSEIGFIAQDVAKVVPEICALDATGEGRGIDYSRMSTLLVGALKAQQEQIAQLKEIVAKLQK